MSVQNSRLLRDSALSVAKAIPAAAASNNSPTIDLGSGPFRPEQIVLEIVIPATPSLADTKALTIKLQDSADDSSYADVDPLIQTSVTGAGGVGASAKTVRLKLPPAVRRYIQFNQAVAAAGGDSTALSVTYSVLL